MSALWAMVPGLRDESDEATSRGRLRAVPPPARRMARVPFLLVLIAVFALGMAGLLMLNTTLQNQAFQARALNRQATELTYLQADLENQLDVAAAPQQLARRAAELGMRPNPYPALLVAPQGTVLGEAKPVTGHELPGLAVKSPQQLKADAAAAAAKKKALADAKAREA